MNLFLRKRPDPDDPVQLLQGFQRMPGGQFLHLHHGHAHILFALVNKMRELEVEISDMKRALLENIRLSNTADDDMAKLNNRVNDLRKQIIEMMNKGENSNE